MKKYIVLSGIPLPIIGAEFENVVLNPDKLLDKPVQSHPDMILSVYDGSLHCHVDYYNENKNIIDYIIYRGSLSLCTSNCKRTKEYPYDVAFNVLAAGTNLIGKKSFLAPKLAELCTVNTKQGYAGCTALFAADTVITADQSTIKACKLAGIPVFEISGEDIMLDGYNIGFIGGACGTVEDKVFIYGDYSKSKSGIELKKFCTMKKLELISLSSSPVCDIGGIKFIEVYN